MATFSGMAAHKPGYDMAPFEYTPRPLGANDVEVAITHCGVCHSDLHAISGDWGPIPYPMIPGHEIVGHVRAVGSAVTKHKVGDAVGVGPEVLSCGDCYMCKEKHEPYCGNGLFLYGSKKYDDSDVVVHGGYCNGIRVHEHFAIALPAGFDLERGAPLLCAGVTVYTPLKEHGTGVGKKVGVIGIGGLGHLAIMFASKMGAETWALSRSNSKADEAQKLGAKGLLAETDVDAFAQHAGSFDLLIMTAAAELDFTRYFALLKKRATFVFIGAMGNLKVPSSMLLFSGINVTGSLIGSPADMDDMLAFATAHDVYPWATTRPLSDADAVVKDVRDGKARYRYVLQIENKL